MKYFHLIWCNLKRKKLRTALTLLSILIAFVLYGLLCSIQQALNGGVEVAGANRLIVRHKVSLIMSLPISYEDRMAKIPGIDLVAHQTWFGGVYQDPKNFFMQTPVEPGPFLSMHPEMLLPSDQKEAWLRTRTGAVVGRATAKKFGWKIGDKVPIRSTIFAQKDGSRVWDFDIVGIYDGKEKNTDTTTLFFRYDFFDEARTVNKGQVGWYTIRVTDPDKSAEIAKLVDREFENSDAETKTEPEGAFAQGFAKQIGNIVMLVSVILAAVFFTILLVAGNTMAQAVRERTGELGVLKAIGFTNGQILGLVLAESCLMSVLGGLLGLGAAWLFTSGGDPTGGLLPLFFFPTSNLLLGVGLAVLLGLLTGIFPALQAMRLQVANALRRM